MNKEKYSVVDLAHDIKKGIEENILNNKVLKYPFFSKGFTSFLDRNHLSLSNFAKKFDLHPTSVWSWKNGYNAPTFAKVIELFENGMTLNEMFGEELAGKILNNSTPQKTQFLDKDFKEGVREVLEEIAREKGVSFSSLSSACAADRILKYDK